MTEEKHRCQQFSDPKSRQESFLSLFNQHKCLPVLSVVIILASVAIKYLTELKLIFGLSNSLPWGNPVLLWCCFFLYSLGLIWISLVLSQRLFSKSVTSESPNALTTLRSHLTFLPIIHFIRQRPACTFENSAGILSNDQGDGASLHSNGDDKEYLSKLEFQRDSLIDAILESCLFPWYERISDEKTFPQQSKQILQATFDRLAKKFRHMDRTAITREVIEIIHYHWKSYCEAATKPSSTEENHERNFKFVHSCVETREELSKHYENIVRLLLKDLVIPDLQSNLLCQFLAGILVKGFLLYYIEMISDPKWINTTIKKYITDGSVNTAVPSILSTGSSQDSLPESMSPASKCDSLDSQSNQLEFEELSSGEIIPLVRLVDGETTQNPPQASLDSNEVSSSQSVEENPVGSNLNRINGEDKNKKPATLSAALGGVLSTTALTLLPEGSSYNLKGLNGAESGETSRASPTTSQHSQTQHGCSDKDNTQPGDNQMPSGDQPAPVESPSANKSMIPINSRHFSLDDSNKGKTTLAEEKTSKSLDESTGNCNVIRQQEFNFSFDDTNKLQVDSTSGKNDVSPTYDEPEDFAATIAKLRSLLEQRESQKNLVENINFNDNEPEVFNSSPPEKHSPEKVTPQQSPLPIKSAVDNIRPSLNSQSSASSLGSDASFGSNNSHSSLDTEKLEKIVDELEDTGPVINRFFLNVAIPKTEACSDSSGNFILYCIQYEGVYVEENDDGQLEKLVLRTTTIKRRFQEFLMLQSHMEESSLWRPHIKGIKAPNKWLNLSFSKSESTNLSQRKINLEKYLQQLCYHPVLGFCPQLRQFMAYGEDGFQAFASSDAIPLHRFDKLAKKFTGVFNSLRDALPSFEPELLTTNATDPVGKSPTDNKAKSLFSSFLRAEKMEKSEDSAKAMEEIDTMDSKPKDGSVITDSNSGSNPSQIKSDIGINLPPEDFSFNLEPPVSTTSETLTGESLAEGAMDAVYPLAVAATQLLCDVLWLPHHRPHSASVAAFLSISGKPFENYLQDFLDVLFSKEAFLGYIEMATAAIKEWAKDDTPVDQEPEIPETSEEELKICLKQKIPVWVRWMWGRSRLDMTIDRLTKVCQETQINQDLILSLVELLFSKLVDSIELETEELK